MAIPPRYTPEEALEEEIDNDSPAGIEDDYLPMPETLSRISSRIDSIKDILSLKYLIEEFRSHEESRDKFIRKPLGSGLLKYAIADFAKQSDFIYGTDFQLDKVYKKLCNAAKFIIEMETATAVDINRLLARRVRHSAGTDPLILQIDEEYNNIHAKTKLEQTKGLMESKDKYNKTRKQIVSSPENNPQGRFTEPLTETELSNSLPTPRADHGLSLESAQSDAPHADVLNWLPPGQISDEIKAANPPKWKSYQGLTAIEFVAIHYKQWLGRGLTTSHLYQYDPPLRNAVGSAISQGFAPPDFDLPSRNERNKRWIAAHPKGSAMSDLGTDKREAKRLTLLLKRQGPAQRDR